MAEHAGNLRTFPTTVEQTLTAKSVLVSAIKPSRIVWMCKGRLAAGKITVLDGDPGLGKSTIVLDWVARITRGRALPGMDGWTEDIQVTAPRGVVLLSAEDGESDTIRPRLDIANADTNRVAVLKMVDESGNEYLPTLGRHLYAIERLIEATNASLLVVDPLMAYLDAEVNANRDQDVRRVFSPIASMAERTGCAVIVLRHLNKATGMSALYRGGGSVGIIGGARVGLLAHKDNDDESGQRRLLMVQKANIGPEALTLIYRLQGVEGTDHARVEWLGESTVTANSVMAQSADPIDRADATDAELWLAEFLETGPLPSNEVYREGGKAGFAQRTLKRAKVTLNLRAIRQGYGKDGTWLWSLPDQVAKPASDQILKPKPTTVDGDPFGDDDE